MIAATDPLKSRALRAVWIGAYNTLIFILIPTLVGAGIGEVYATTPLLISSFVYEFGAIITVLQVIGTLAEGSPVSVPFTSGGYIVAAYFVWTALSGGTLPLTYNGVNISFAFQPILFLLIMPLLFSALKEPIEFLLEQSEAGLPSPDSV